MRLKAISLVVCLLSFCPNVFAFETAIQGRADTNGFQLSWISTPPLKFAAESQESLTDGTWLAVANSNLQVSTLGDRTTLTDMRSNATSRFYRVGFDPETPLCTNVCFVRKFSLLDVAGRDLRTNVLKLFSAAVDPSSNRLFVTGILTEDEGVLNTVSQTWESTLHTGDTGWKYLWVDDPHRFLYLANGTSGKIKTIHLDTRATLAETDLSTSPDTVVTVIQPLTRRAPKSSPESAVNNCGAPKIKVGEKHLRPRYNVLGRIAPDGSRSTSPCLTKATASAPDRPAASVPKSERTIACEAPCIRMTCDQATMHNKKGKPMKSWNEITHYAGFDWARDHHQVVIVNPQGQIVADFQFDHTSEGWKIFSDKTAPFGNLAVAIETSQGAAVDQLLQRDWTVYPVNPAAAVGYRQRKAPSGTKTDQIDAWSLADALRVDGQGWKPLHPMNELTCQLRLLCRDEVVLIEQRTLLLNQLQQALVEYYPAALEAFADWSCPATWDFVVQFPTPEMLVKAGRRRWEKFLHLHRLWWSATVEKRLELFARADQFQSSAPIVKAKSQLAVSLCQCLRTLQAQLEIYREQIEALFAQHPDHDLFGGLPGAGKTLAPRLLASIGSDPARYTTFQVLQSFAGTAPISFKSGQIDRVKIRRNCDKFLRHTVHLWANCFRENTVWGQAYYAKKRKDGMSHACALRCLGQRLLKIIFRIITDKQPYDAERHARNQQKHGSWVLTLLAKPAIQTGG